LMVMRAGQPFDWAQIDTARLPPFAILREKSLARKDLPPRPCQLLGDRNTNDAIIARAFAELTSEELPFGLVHTDDGAIWPAFGKEPPLGRKIAAKTRMAIKVIGAEIGENRDVGRQGARQLGLIAA